MAARFNEQHGDVGCARSAMSGGSGAEACDTQYRSVGGRRCLVSCVCLNECVCA